MLAGISQAELAGVQRCYMRLIRSALPLAGYAPYYIAHIVRH